MNSYQDWEHIESDQDLLKNIVRAYRDPKVQRLKFNSVDMWSIIQDSFTKLDKSELFRENPDLSKEENEIVQVIKKCYQIHYIDNKIMYQLMDRDTSFATSIAMYLYH